MKTMKKILILVVLLFSATKAYEQQPILKGNSGNVDVYVAGVINNVSTLWKNGIPISLTNGKQYNSSYANDVYVANNDVYVAGTITIEKYGKTVATLWKNGEEIRLTDGTKSAYAISVFVTDRDVYVAGHIGSSAVLWKNGIANFLSGRESIDSEANSVFVTGSDVYVAGCIGSVAVLWKNGTPTYLTGKKYGHAKDVFVSGSNVYVVGESDYPKTDFCSVTLWKNGIPTYLTGKTDNEDGGCSSNWGNAVCVSGNNIYVAGSSEDCSVTLWTNGKPVFIKDKDGAANYSIFGAKDVAVYGNDVYLVGTCDHDYAILWKNGIPTYLTKDNVKSSAHSVFVGYSQR